MILLSDKSTLRSCIGNAAKGSEVPPTQLPVPGTSFQAAGISPNLASDSACSRKTRSRRSDRWNPPRGCLSPEHSLEGLYRGVLTERLSQGSKSRKPHCTDFFVRPFRIFAGTSWNTLWYNEHMSQIEVYLYFWKNGIHVQSLLNNGQICLIFERSNHTNLE